MLMRSTQKKIDNKDNEEVRTLLLRAFTTESDNRRPQQRFYQDLNFIVVWPANHDKILVSY